MTSSNESGRMVLQKLLTLTSDLGRPVDHEGWIDG